VVALAQDTDRIDIAIRSFVAEFDFAFLNYVKVISSFTFVEDIFPFNFIVDHESIDQLQLFVLLEHVEQLDLVHELKGNVPASYAILSYDEFEAFSSQHPGVALDYRLH
jgi:hypothetical protein